MTETPGEHIELRAFLASLRPGDVLVGVVARIERFGVFVALDEGPGHPVFAGVGFISPAELSWTRFEAITDVVEPGQRVACEFLQCDEWNLEARLSLKAMRPDPLRAFADTVPIGSVLQGKVTETVSFGVFVEVAEGVEGLVHASGPPALASARPRTGDRVSVRLASIDRLRRRVRLELSNGGAPGHPARRPAQHD